jgi:raffinose/stachyose/melibiose transport system substrate-binding protein
MVSWSRQRRSGLGIAGVALAAAAVLAACGSGTQESGGASGGGDEITLTLTAIADNRPAWNELIADYKKVAPNVTIKGSYAPTDQLQTSLRAQLGGGNAPDLFVNWPGNGSAMAVQQLAPSGLVADISDQSWISSVPDGLKPLLGSDGKTYM